MREKFLALQFGYCPRVYCFKQPVLPVGLNDNLKVTRVKIFCPKCEDIYAPKKKCRDVDGAFFGTSFSQLFLFTYPDLLVEKSEEKYVP